MLPTSTSRRGGGQTRRQGRGNLGAVELAKGAGEQGILDAAGVDLRFQAAQAFLGTDGGGGAVGRLGLLEAVAGGNLRQQHTRIVHPRSPGFPDLGGSLRASLPHYRNNPQGDLNLNHRDTETQRRKDRERKE